MVFLFNIVLIEMPNDKPMFTTLSSHHFARVFLLKVKTCDFYSELNVLLNYVSFTIQASIRPSLLLPPQDVVYL